MAREEHFWSPAFQPLAELSDVKNVHDAQMLAAEAASRVRLILAENIQVGSAEFEETVNILRGKGTISIEVTAPSGTAYVGANELDNFACIASLQELQFGYGVMLDPTSLPKLEPLKRLRMLRLDACTLTTFDEAPIDSLVKLRSLGYLVIRNVYGIDCLRRAISETRGTLIGVHQAFGQLLVDRNLYSRLRSLDLLGVPGVDDEFVASLIESGARLDSLLIAYNSELTQVGLLNLRRVPVKRLALVMCHGLRADMLIEIVRNETLESLVLEKDDGGALGISDILGHVRIETVPSF